jgi:hypothetical protein
MLASVGRPCHVNVCYLKCLPWKSQKRVYFHAITRLRPKLSAGGLSTRFPRNRYARMHAMSWLARLDAYGACEFLPSKLLSSCVVKRLHAAAIKAASLLVDIHAPEAHLFCAAQGLFAPSTCLRSTKLLLCTSSHQPLLYTFESLLRTKHFFCGHHIFGCAGDS